MKKKKITFYPSIWALKPWEIKDYIKAFESNKKDVEFLHFDVMDGHYVPNVAMGTDQMKLYHDLTRLPIDAHFMCLEPEKFMNYFDLRKGDSVSFHPEVCYQPYRLLMNLRERGIKAGYAMSPQVPMDYVREALPVLDFVNFMTINPGFFGQSMVPNAVEKMKRMREILDTADHKIKLVVDGSVIPQNAVRYLEAGADALIVGPSTIMKGPKVFTKTLKAYKKEVGID